MTDLLSLAGRVEAAMGADRELDALVCEAVGAWSQRGYDQRNGMRPRGAEPLTLLAYLRDGVALNYSSSIDAAMTLVPEGWRTGMVSEMEHRDDWHWRLVAKRGHDRYGKAGVNGVARTLALALCSAALRARAAQGEG